MLVTPHMLLVLIHFFVGYVASYGGRARLNLYP